MYIAIMYQHVLTAVYILHQLEDLWRLLLHHQHLLVSSAAVIAHYIRGEPSV